MAFDPFESDEVKKINLFGQNNNAGNSNGGFDPFDQKNQNNDDDNVLQVLYHNLASATGDTIHTTNDALARMNKPANMSEEDWQAALPGLSKNISQFGENLEDEHKRTYSDPFGWRNILGGVVGVVPYGVALGVGTAAAMRSGNAQMLGQEAAQAARMAGIFGRYTPQVAKAAEILAPAATIDVARTIPEAGLEWQGAYDGFIDDAKKDGSYVKGETESKAEQVANGVFKDNIGLLSGTNLLETLAIVAKLPTGPYKSAALKILGTSLSNAGEEAAQQIFPKAEADKPWSLNDEDVKLSALIGGISGGAPVVAGMAYDKYYPKKKDKGEVATGDNNGFDRFNSNDNSNDDSDDNSAGGGSGGYEAFKNSIVSQESGGNYDAKGEVQDDGDYAIGKYQIMKSNWAQWAQDAGLDADAEPTPENQEIVADAKLKPLYEKYGARNAAIAWYGGEGAIDYSEETKNRKQGNAPSINEYADSVVGRMGGASQSEINGAPSYADVSMDDKSYQDIKAKLIDFSEGLDVKDGKNIDLFNDIQDTVERGDKNEIFKKAQQVGIFPTQEAKTETGTNTQTEEEAQPQANVEGNNGIGKTIENVRNERQQYQQIGLKEPQIQGLTPGVNVAAKPSTPALARLASKAKAIATRPTGATVQVKAGEGANTTEFDTQYKLVDASDLTISNDPHDYKPNKLYPQELQPRTRDSAAMRAQVENIAGNMRPADLTASRDINNGAPLINADGVVENGNGRTMAIIKALKATANEGKRKANGEAYKQYLMDNAEQFGFTKEQVAAMKSPVLVRQRMGDVDVNKVIASTAGGAVMSASEQANADAKALSTTTLKQYQENDNGDLTTAANLQFVGSALKDVTGNDANQLNALATADGKVSQQGIARVRNALFAKAYKDNGLLALMSESTDNNIRTITNAMINAAPYLADIQAKMENGALHNYDLTSDLAAACKKLMALRNEGKPVSLYLQEGSMFGEEISITAKQILQYLDENKKSAKKIRDMLLRVGELVEQQGDPKQIKLLAGEENISLDSLYKSAMGDVEGASLFEKNQNINENSEPGQNQKSNAEVTDNGSMGEVNTGNTTAPAETPLQANQSEQVPVQKSKVKASQVDYDKIQREIDNLEDKIIAKYGEEAFLSAPTIKPASNSTDLFKQDYAEEVRKSPISAEELGRLSALYEKRDLIGQAIDDVELKTIMSRIPNTSTVSREDIVEVIKLLQKDKKWDDINETESKSTYLDAVQYVYNKLSHALAKNDKIPYEFIGDFEQAIDYLRNPGAYAYVNYDLAPIMQDVKNIVDGIIGVSGNEAQADFLKLIEKPSRKDNPKVNPAKKAEKPAKPQQERRNYTAEETQKVFEDKGYKIGDEIAVSYADSPTGNIGYGTIVRFENNRAIYKEYYNSKYDGTEPYKISNDGDFYIYTNRIEGKNPEVILKHSDNAKIAEAITAGEEKKKSTNKPVEAKHDKSDFGNRDEAVNELSALIGKKTVKQQQIEKAETLQHNAALEESAAKYEDNLDDLLKEMHSELNNLSANPVFNPKIYEIGFKIGIVLVKRGAKNFTAWKQQMVDTIKDEKIKPWLESIWTGIRSYPQDTPLNEQRFRAFVKYVGTNYDKNINSVYATFEKDFGKDTLEEFKPLVNSAWEATNAYFNPKLDVAEAATEVKEEPKAEPVKEEKLSELDQTVKDVIYANTKDKKIANELFDIYQANAMDHWYDGNNIAKENRIKKALYSIMSEEDLTSDSSTETNKLFSLIKNAVNNVKPQTKTNLYNVGSKVAWTSKDGKDYTGTVVSDQDESDTDIKVMVDQGEGSGIIGLIKKISYLELSNKSLHKLNTEEAKPQVAETKPDDVGATFNLNKEHQGIEIKFNGKPDASVITNLKANGFRWSPRNKNWYAKQSNSKAMKFAESIGFKPEKVVQLGQEDSTAKVGANNGLQQDKIGADKRSTNQELPAVPIGERTEGIQKNAEAGERGRADKVPVTEQRDIQTGHSGSAIEERSDTGERNGLGESAAHDVPGNASEGVRSSVTKRQGLTSAQKKGAKASEVPGHNFHITEEDNIGKGGLKTKYNDNIAAIKLLKQLESEQRQATPEEQKILAKYVGWGGLSPVFNLYDRSGNAEWGEERKELKALLTPEEYESARRSTLNAHYTSIGVINGIWNIVDRLGFKGGRILEPSMGIGNFFGAMPTKLMNNSSLTGIELDGLTGRIAKQLYQKANIEITGFEKMQIPDNFYDLAISNVPFGDFSLHDPKYDKFHYNIHNYFFAKALDKVRPGGLIVFITGSGTMQSGKDAALLRKQLEGKADMLGAIRLPNTAFKQNANTEVTTDLIVLRKRAEGEQASKNNNVWLETTDSDVNGKYSRRPLSINEYYKNNPNMLIGKLSEDTLYAGRLALDGNGLDVTEELQSRVGKFPTNVYKPLEGKKQDSVEGAKTFLAPSNVREQSYIVKDKVAYQRINGDMVAVPKAEQGRVVSFTNVKNAVRSLLSAQIDPLVGDNDLIPLRKELNKTYDTFVKDFGYVNDKNNVNKLSGDPEYGLVRSIEKYDIDKDKKVTATKNAIFEKRTVGAVQNISKADTPSDALATSLTQKGFVDIDYMASLLGKKNEDVIAALEGIVFENPITRNYETADDYLSGNVREKLEAAKEAARNNPAYLKNVEELEKVQPKDLVPSEIRAGLGSPWIPTSDIESFATHILESNGVPIKIIFNASLGNWVVSWNEKDWRAGQAKNSVANNQKWGTSDRSFYYVLDYALNQKSPVVYDTFEDGTKVVNQKKTAAVQEKLLKVKEEFKNWLWSDEERANRLSNYYNNNYNNWRLREYDGSHLDLPGYSIAAPQLRQHQRNAVWRMLQRGNTLLAHCVGAGKTWAMQAAGMEMRRLGIAKKPMYVIPNNMVQQFENEFRIIYPNAKLLVVTTDQLPDVPAATTVSKDKKKAVANGKPQKTVTDNSRAVKNSLRQKMLGRIATEDWDGIIISHNMFKRIPMSPKAYNDFYQEQINEISEAIIALKLAEGKSGNRVVKELEKTIIKLQENMLKDTQEEAKDIAIPFEQLGVDQIFVDEADMFKNLFFSTKMTRIAGISNSHSQRSMDMYVKTQYLTKLNNGRGVVFATGTPISNTMAEMFTMMRYLDMQGLREKNLQYFDSWAATHAETGLTAERSPDGNGYRQTNRFIRFVNAPEMIKMFRKFTDVKRPEELNLPTPKLKNGKVTIVEVETNPALTDYIKVTARERSLAIKNNMVDSSEDNMLKLTNDLRKASLDMRLIDPTLSPAETNGKLLAVTENVFNTYKANAKNKGTQLVFCDLSAPKGLSDKVVESDNTDEDTSINEVEEQQKISVYAEIKKMLIKKGIPANEIVFIHDAKTKEQKQKILDRINTGEIRVLLGSTEKMGAGANVQKKLVALHHVTAPWRPRDIEQREGRILRQGNENEEVEIFTYVTKDSFDANMWEKLKNKANTIAQAMSNNLTKRIIEDMDATVLSFAEVEALASGNPLMAEKTMVDAETTKYGMLYSSFTAQQQENERKMRILPSTIQMLEKEVASIKEDIKNRKPIDGEKFSITIGKKTYTDRKAAGEALKAITSTYDNEMGTVIGAIGGFDLKLQAKRMFSVKIEGNNVSSKHLVVDAILVGKSQYTANSESLQAVEFAVMNMPDKQLTVTEHAIEEHTKNLSDMEKEIAKPFEYQEKYDELLKRQAEINAELHMDELGNDTNAAEETDEEADDEQYSIADKNGQARTNTDVAGSIQKAFPSAKNITQVAEDAFVADMPNGSKIYVNAVDEIVLTQEQYEKAKKDYGGELPANYFVEGSAKTVGKDAIITLASKAADGAIDHEALHVAEKLALTPKEIAAISKKYPSAEERAEAYRAWKQARANGKGGLLGKLWQKVHDFAKQVEAFFGKENAQNVFRKVESGEVWNRESDNAPDVTDIQFSIKAAQQNLFGKLNKEKKEPGSITIEKNKPKDALGLWGNLGASPSQLAKTMPVVKKFFDWATNAMQTQEKLRSYFNRKYNSIMDGVKSKDERQQLHDLLIEGDAISKEWTKQELLDDGVSDNVAEAYRRIRGLMKKAYNLLNDTRKRVQTHTQNMSSEKLEDMLHSNKFIEVLDKTPTEEGLLVRWKEPATWTHVYEGVDENALELMKKNDAVQVLTADKAGTDIDGNQLYDVKTRERMTDLTNNEGYIPHFFHDYIVYERTENEDGTFNYDAVASGNNIKEATKLAEGYLKDNPNAQLFIRAKQFEFDGEANQAVNIGDKAYSKMIKSIAEHNTFTIEEAKELVNGSLTHGKGKHRFFGNFLERKGAKGYEKDMDWVLRHFFNSTARYVALENDFKPQSRSLFERLYGSFDKEYDGVAKYIKDFINDINGNPSALEKLINDKLNSNETWQKHFTSRFGERAALSAVNSITGTVSVLKLGVLNASSALLNFSQLVNAAGLIGDISAVVNGARRLSHGISMQDKKVLVESGVLNDIGLDSGAGYGKLSVGKLGSKSMILFKKSEAFCRRSTILAAYHKAIARGMSHAQAIEYAKDVNRRANFDYGINDSPNSFRRMSIIGQLVLQFKKYPIKELELMSDMLSSRTNAKQKAIFWGGYFLFSGLMQVPVVDLFNDLWEWLFGKNPKTAIKDVMFTFAGDNPQLKALTKWAVYGLGSAANVDFSSRTGIADVVPTSLLEMSGPVINTVLSTAKNIIRGDMGKALTSVSPGMGNIAQAIAGESNKTNGRTNTVYDTAYDRVLRAMGFKSVDEAITTDMKAIVSQRKNEKKNARQQAVDNYLKEPTSENVGELRKLGITPKQVNEERKKKSQTGLQRTEESVSKKERRSYKDLYDFAK